MKKKIGLIFLAATLFSCASAYAEGVQLTDMINGTVTISGIAENVGDIVNILIIENGSSLSEAEGDEEKVIYQSFVTAGEDKIYKRNIQLSGGETGYMEYLVYTGSNPEPDMIVIATVDSKVDLAKAIVAGDKAKIYSVLKEEQSRKILDINTEYIKNADLERVSEKLVNELKNASFDFDNDDKTKVVEDIEKLNTLIKEISIVDCYNNKSITLFEGEKFLYNDILKFDEIKVYEGYSKILNSEGKRNVQNGLLENNFPGIEELRKYFAKLTLFNAIHNDVNSGGYGHITEIYTNENIEYAELNIPNYKKLSNKSKVNSKLVADNSLTLDNFERKIEEYVASSQQGTTGGGAGGGGNSVSIAPGAGTSAAASGIKTEITKPEKPEQEDVKFSDLADSLWAEEAILALNEKGILSGVGNKLFKPGEYLTREQAVKIVCAMNNYPTTENAVKFADVDSGAWYAPFIAQGIENSIINGISENEFGVGKNISRQDFVVLIYRSLENKQEYKGILGFNDAGEISEYAKEAVGYFVDLGVISGYPDNTFAPNGYITRAEAAKIIYGLVK